MPLPPNPSAFAAVPPVADVAPSVEATGPTTVLVQPPGPAAPLPSALAASNLAQAPAPVKAAVGSAPALALNGFNAGLGTPEITPISVGINVILDYFKNRPWFHEKAWTVPLLVILSFAIAFVVWYVLTEQKNLQTAVTNGFSLLGTAHVNYRSMRAAELPVLSPTKEENRWQPHS